MSQKDAEKYEHVERNLKRIFGTETLQIIRAARREMAKARPDKAKLKKLLERLAQEKNRNLN